MNYVERAESLMAKKFFLDIESKQGALFKEPRYGVIEKFFETALCPNANFRNG